MKISSSKLKQIIKEVIKSILKEGKFDILNEYDDYEGKVIDFPKKPSNKFFSGENVEFIFLTGKQALELEKFVNQFEGSILDLLEPVEETEREPEEPELELVAEEEQEEKSKVVPLRLKTAIPKEEPPGTTIGGKSIEELEEGNYVLPLDKDISAHFQEMIQELEEAGKRINNPNIINQAKNWYYNVKELAERIAPIENENEHVLFCMLLAAFSHNTDFYRNLLEALLALRAYQFDLKEEPGCLTEYIEAFKYFTSTEGPKFGKLKLTNFALNILDPKFGEDPLNYWNSTIDRWMYRAFYQREEKPEALKKLHITGASEKELTYFAGKEIVYIYLAKVLAEEARKYDMVPHQLQAVIWVSIMHRRRGRIDTLETIAKKMKGQLNNITTDIDKTIKDTREDVPDEDAKDAITRMFSRISDVSNLKTTIKSLSSKGKVAELDAFEQDILKLDKTTCEFQKLNLYYVLEKYVGMREDKKKNMKKVFLKAISNEWTINNGIKFLRNLVNLDVRKAGKIIPQ